MLGSNLLSRTGLLNYIKMHVAGYCQKYNIEPISVSYGKVAFNAKAHFQSLPPKIVVWDKLSEWLSKESHYNRVWYVMHVIGHELEHYRQYHNQQEKRLIPRKELMPEDEAYMAGFDFADSNIRLMSKEKINPVAACPKCLNTVLVNPRVRSGRCPHCRANLIVNRETKNWGKQFWTATKQEREQLFKEKGIVVNPADSSLYESFHGVPPKGTCAVSWEPPKKGAPLVKIGRMYSVTYEPEAPSQHKTTRFEHVFGDDGHNIYTKDRPVLATDQDGKNLYIVRDKDTKWPVFTNRGIIR